MIPLTHPAKKLTWLTPRVRTLGSTTLYYYKFKKKVMNHPSLLEGE